VQKQSSADRLPHHPYQLDTREEASAELPHSNGYSQEEMIFTLIDIKFKYILTY
jgi:hypothetical protein